MKIAVSATGTDLSAQVDPRFGRCQHLIIVDPETLAFEAIENSNISAGGGAGIATAQVVAGKDVQAVLTGNCGPNAYEVLSAAGIAVITGVSGTVQDAVDGYKAGRYQAASGATVGAHSGMRPGGGMGMGRGMAPNTVTPSRSDSQEQEIQKLNTQVRTLAQQLSDVQGRIDALEKASK